MKLKTKIYKHISGLCGGFLLYGNKLFWRFWTPLAEMNFKRYMLCATKQKKKLFTSFAPSDLSEFWRSFILCGAEEVVGVVQAAGERHLLLVSIVTVPTYVFLIRQHLRHDCVSLTV